MPYIGMSQACQEEWDVTFSFKMLSLVKAVMY